MKKIIFTFLMAGMALSTSVSAQIIQKIADLEKRLEKIESSSPGTINQSFEGEINELREVISGLQNSQKNELSKVATDIEEMKSTQSEVETLKQSTEVVQNLAINVEQLQTDIENLKNVTVSQTENGTSTEIEPLFADLKGLLGELKSSIEETTQTEYKTADKAIKITGDFRLRNEAIDQPAKEQRNRQRIRARVNLAGKMSEDIAFTLRLASGSSDSPISTNQTMDSGFSSKSMWIDRAYFEWKPAQYEGLNVLGGKIKNPFITVGKSQLLWDGDLNPEGAAFQLKKNKQVVDVFVNAATFVMDERKSEKNAWMFGGQTGLEYNAPTYKVTAGVGYFSFSNAQGNTTFVDDGDSYGNTVDEDGNYFYGFDEMEVFSELSTKFNGLPLLLFADYVMNDSADENNTGYAVGLGLNKCKKPGSWELKYSYEYLEKDAVIGALTDSDFAGGGTDGKGHKFGVGYQLTGQIKTGVTYLLNDAGVEDGVEYHRVQMDLNCKF